MCQSTDSRKHLSLMLSEVLDDIGVNERMVTRARRVNMLMETMNTITWKSFKYNLIAYILGSQIEGTTTLGLKPDFDELICRDDYSVIQDWSEWEHDKENYFMIQDENTTPGYCFLQLTKHDKPLPANIIRDDLHVTDRNGRILHKNTIYAGTMLKNETWQGPSLAKQGQHGISDSDSVLALPCKSWPKSASGWLEKHGIGRWPTLKMRTYAASTQCFVVPTGSKVSENPELEWRISTCLAERCLMFDLNMTQIKCYVLMKMVLKSFLKTQDGINISSFMCKIVLLHYIENNEQRLWKDEKLLECLKYCLMELRTCVQNGNLSHFIIPENNLMAGQFTIETENKLLKNISDFLQNDIQSLLRINIDNFSQNLQVKLNLVSERHLYSSHGICERLSGSFFFVLSRCRSKNHGIQLNVLRNVHIRVTKHFLERLITYSKDDNQLEHDACTFLALFLFSTYGSVLASASIGFGKQISPQAYVWLLDGFDSDVSSGRLKLASVFYCAGDMEKTEHILRYTESQYFSYPVVLICGCTDERPPTASEITEKFARVCFEQNEDCVKNITAFCVRFLKHEINCVPRELQYELFRSIQEDMKHRDQDFDYWMDWAVVDSLPFLYFLQYKVYRHLQRYQDQQQAINNLANVIETDINLRHKETALNILGQCMEQENRPKQAIKCYLLSLRQRARINVANIHICRLVSSLLVGKTN